MSFSLRVWCGQLDECFPVPVPRLPIDAVELKGLIRSSGELTGFTSAGWDLYLADALGAKEGAALRFDHRFNPAAGSIVNVWVEPKPGAAGELWGPGC
jgi:hypothetical protein